MFSIVILTIHVFILDLATIIEKMTILGLKEAIGEVEALGTKEPNHTINHTGIVLL
jgi:hypothetical protein